MAVRLLIGTLDARVGDALGDGAAMVESGDDHALFESEPATTRVSVA